MQRIAIIDIGSNSARLVITHIYKNGAYNMVYNQKEALRLSQKVDKNGLLTPQAFSDTIETLKTFACMCKLYNADHIIAVATAAIRNAKNGAELTHLVQKETGINLHIITGNTEAYYSYLGVINTLPYESGIIFDLGGGSTELIYFEERKILESVSVPIGAVNTTAMFNTRGSVNAATFSELCAYLRRRLGEYPWLKQPKLPLIGVGGTARTIGKIHQRATRYPTTKIHNYKLTLQAFRGILNRLKCTTLEERRKISGLSTERADIIIAGASIINALFEVTGSKQLITSGCGLREGLFFDYHAKETGIPPIAEDILERSTEKILTLYTPDPTHSRHITDLSLQMFDSWHALHRLNKNFRRLLKTASLLHDIGITINFYSHARHSAYMIQNAQLFGLTHKEQLMASAVAGWHNGISKSYFYRDQLFQTMLTENNWQAVNKLALILALAESLDYTQSSLLAIKSAGADKNGAYLTLTASGNAAIEMHQIRTHLKWFAKTFGMPLDIKIEEE